MSASNADNELVCPKCKCRSLLIINGGFLERGPYLEARKVYADEMEVTGRRCTQCNLTILVGELNEDYDEPK